MILHLLQYGKNYYITYCPKNIKEDINWFPFLNIMEYTAYSIGKDITFLPSLLKMFLLFQMRFWYNKETDD